MSVPGAASSVPTIPSSLLVVGFGATNRAVARALVARGHAVVATDDAPTDATTTAAAALGVALEVAPDPSRLAELIAAAGAVVPGPGVPERHPCFALADAAGVPVLTEFDVAAAWDDRPIVAITGTDGKTTVTTLITDMVNASGTRAVDAGNNDLPLVAAIDDADTELFVVEASSFRLGRSRSFRPRVALWLNVAPDHLDVHDSVDTYVAAKSRIWSAQAGDDMAIGNLRDDLVREALAAAPARTGGFCLGPRPDDAPVFTCWSDDRLLYGPDGPLLAIDDLPRALPHDIENSLAAAAAALAAGVPGEVVAAELRRTRSLPHRVAEVATVDGVTWYDDSKATVPHATLAALRGFRSVVLIAGGRNKGLDLSELVLGAGQVKAVVAIGEAAAEVAAAFDGVRPVAVASSMSDAVDAAADVAEPGDTVLLSPACASFDWYGSYGERGDDFAALVRARPGAAPHGVPDIGTPGRHELDDTTREEPS